MERRSFLRNSALGSATLLGGTALPLFTPRAAGQSSRDFSIPEFEIEEANISDLQRDMAAGRRTSRAITEAYITRIGELDARGPTLRHVIEINPDALAIAERLDVERRARGARGPLHGIPVLLKDNIDTADRTTTTAGSLALQGSVPARDAFIAQRLRAAGAVLLGKANLSEWANFRSTRSSSGWSARGGQGKNPYVLDRNPCGSSSGSAAAVAANYCAVAVGTETDGSIVCPSSANAIVGIKPTLGLVSRSGIIPIAHSQDTAGPMARTVTDAAILLNALVGRDSRDSATTAARVRTERDYTTFLDSRGLRGARIGVARRRFFGYNEEADAVIQLALSAMRQAGATIVDPADVPHAGEYDNTEFEVLLYEFKSDLNAYLASLPRSTGRPRIRTLKDVIDFNERNRSVEMPWFGQEIMLMAQEKGPLTTPEYRRALARNHRLSRAEGIDAVVTRHRLDAIVAPTGSPPWPIDLINGDHFTGASSTPAAVAGYPNISVPAGYVYGLPVGISFFGRAFSEGKLISIAYAFEQATQHRKPPRFLSSADLPAAPARV